MADAWDASSYLEAVASDDNAEARLASGYVESANTVVGVEAHNASSYLEAVASDDNAEARSGLSYLEVLMPTSTASFVGWGVPI